MSANSDYIPMTIRLENELYKEFHALAEAQASTHTGIVRLLIKEWIASKRQNGKQKSKAINSSHLA